MTPELEQRIAIVKRIKQLFPIVQTLTLVNVNSECYRGEHNIAHAHNNNRLSQFGKICIAEYDRKNPVASLWDFDHDRPTSIILHEIAHLYAPYPANPIAHSDIWAREYSKLRDMWDYPYIESITPYD